MMSESDYRKVSTLVPPESLKMGDMIAYCEWPSDPMIAIVLKSRMLYPESHGEGLRVTRKRGPAWWIDCIAFREKGSTPLRVYAHFDAKQLNKAKKIILIQRADAPQ